MSQINKIGVIGAGNMGSGIAQKIAQEGINVVLVDITDEFVERGLGIIKQLLSEGVERKIFTAGQVEEIFTRITGTTDFNAVADADLVIEAVFEDKQGMQVVDLEDFVVGGDMFGGAPAADAGGGGGLFASPASSASRRGWRGWRE